VKQTAAILLIAMLLFNWIGFRLFTTYLSYKADLVLEAQLDDEHYNEAHLVSIKVPLQQLAYYNGSKYFERVEGQIEIGGTIYKFVKRRLYNDSIELLCIPDHSAMQIASAKDEFFKLVNDLQSEMHPKKTDAHKNASKSFFLDQYALQEQFSLVIHHVNPSRGIFLQPGHLLSSFAFRDEQPPDLPC
jgi:hypothetical protein